VDLTVLPPDAGEDLLHGPGRARDSHR
jgi:hypothetical protein